MVASVVVSVVADVVVSVVADVVVSVVADVVVSVVADVVVSVVGGLVVGLVSVRMDTRVVVSLRAASVPPVWPCWPLTGGRLPASCGGS